MHPIKAPSRLPELVKSAFTKARTEGDLTYFQTQVVDVQVGSIPFQLRFSPALANKPKGPSSKPKLAEKPFDPFAYEPRPKLFIHDIGTTHYLVLNKFAIVPEHFILATREFAPQTNILEEADLAAALACIQAYDTEGAGLFVFFNGGDHSGASQPHRHLQLLPIERMRDGLSDDSPWDVLVSSTKSAKEAPFVTFREHISTNMTASTLYSTYLRLYKRACIAMEANKGSAIEEEGIAETGSSRISYNLAITKDTLVVCPRLSEGGQIVDVETGSEVGSLSLNGTMLAGTALVKTEAEWNALRSRPEGLAEVLKLVGLPQSKGFANI